jgi:AcrR family transcriptional regulator
MGRTLTFDRGEVLKKAMSIFWEHGYQGSSLKMLESALKLRPASLYHSFGNKDQLYIEALDLYAKQLVGELDSAISSKDGLLAGLEYFLSELVIPSQGSRPSRACLIVKTLLEMGDQGGVVAGKADALLQAMEDYFVLLLDAAKLRGEFIAETDSKILARQLQVQIIGIRGFAQRKNVEEQLPTLISDAIKGLTAHHSTTTDT